MSRKSWMGLAKLCEELAEVIQVSAKLAACPEGKYFDGKDLVKWLENELADAMAIIQFVEDNNDIVISSKRVEEKYRKFNEWYRGMNTGLSVNTNPMVNPLEYQDLLALEVKSDGDDEV